MKHPSHRLAPYPAFFAALLALLPAAAIGAQDSPTPPGRTLADLDMAFRQQFMDATRAAEGRLSATQVKEILAKQVKELRSFIANEAKGDDRFNGRLMLVDRLGSSGDFDGAKKALSEMDVEACPALILLTAANLGARLQMDELPVQWKSKALQKDAPFEDRMTMGMLLMTVFVDVEGGEKLFADALAAAGDNEERSKVDWFRARAIREREDLPEGAYDEELRALASKWPGTRYGKIAADRLQAMEYEVGGELLPLDAVDMNGEPVLLEQYKGKVVLLDTWTSQSTPWVEAVPFLKDLQAKYGDDGFVIIGVCVDRDLAAAKEAMATHGVDWRQICDGKGWDSDLVLRHNIETVPHTVLIGRDGKIAALTLHATSERSRKQLREAVEAALGQGATGGK